MSRGLAGRLGVNAGFRTERLLTFRIALPWRTYDDARTDAFYRNALARLRGLPGVEAVATSDNPPLCGQSDAYRTTVTLAGQATEDRQRNPYVDAQTVSPGYFQVLGIPALRGRVLTEADGPQATAVAVVGQRFATRFWPQANPIGQRLQVGNPTAESPWYEVVGVVGDVQRDRLGDGAGLDLYLSLWQSPSANAFVLARVAGDPTALTGPATREVWSVDRDQSTFDFATLEDRIAESFWRQRASAALCAVFALLATALASIGIFGVASFAVGQRTREIGIRMALGAEPGGVLRMILREMLAVLVVGLAAGLVATLGLARLLGHLFGPQGALDPLVLGLVSLFLALVTLLAAALPARRAARIDPLEALRES
jgi:putative ABC transport system permease protein